MPYTPHLNFIATAREKSELWRTIAGLILCVTIYVSGMAIVGPTIMAFSTGMADVSPPTFTLAVLISFAFMALGPAVTVVLLHKRSPQSLFGDQTQGLWDFWRAAKAVFLLQAVIILASAIGLQGENNVVANLSFGTWILFLPFSLLGLFIQTSAEEILFRGYLQQQLAARFSSPLIWMIVPAVLFALGHYDSENGDNAWTIVIWAAFFSIAASDLVARTGNLGAAIGLHFVNNFFGILIVSYPGVLSGLSLYTLLSDPSKLAPSSIEMFLEFATLALSWLAVRVAVRR